MKKLTFYAMPMLFLMAMVGSHTNILSQPPNTAILRVRIYFGSQMGGHAVGPCSEIKIVVTPQNGKPIEQAAYGPEAGAKGGDCRAYFKNVPAGVPIVLKAVYSDLTSKADDTHELPLGKWSNPLTLKAGSSTTRYIKIDGKP